MHTQKYLIVNTSYVEDNLTAWEVIYNFSEKKDVFKQYVHYGNIICIIEL